jgi:hypothetical protein
LLTIGKTYLFHTTDGEALQARLYGASLEPTSVMLDPYVNVERCEGFTVYKPVVLELRPRGVTILLNWANVITATEVTQS